MITNTSWRIKKMIKKYNPHDRSTWPSNPDQKKKAMEEPFGDALRRVRSKKDVKNLGAREILKSIKPSNIDEYEKVVDHYLIVHITIEKYQKVQELTQQVSSKKLTKIFLI